MIISFEQFFIFYLSFLILNQLRKELQYYIFLRKRMEKLFDAANFIKAKLAKDQLYTALLHITSEENWQPSTKQMHQIANAAYNYQKWQKINDFIWERLKKSKSWKKILKSMILVEFLIKNGPSNVISAYKHDINQFEGLKNYIQIEQGIDRGQTIRQTAKKVIQLLQNQQILQQEREAAKKIRDRMSNIVSQSEYSNTTSRYGNLNQWKPRYQIDTKKQHQVNSSAYGDDYNSTLKKYKGSSKNLTPENLQKSGNYQINQQSKKSFESEGKKLQRSANAQVIGFNMNQKDSYSKIDEDLFSFDNQKRSQSFKQKKEQSNIQFGLFSFDRKQQDQFNEYEQAKSIIQSPSQSFQPLGQTKKDDQFLPYQQIPNLNRYYSEGNVFAGGYFQPQKQQQINQFQISQFMNGFTTSEPQHFNQIGQFQTSKKHKQVHQPYASITLSVASTKKSHEDNQFQAFQPTSQHVKWMSATEKNLTDLTGFGDQIKMLQQKKSEQKVKKQNIQIDIWNW